MERQRIFVKGALEDKEPVAYNTEGISPPSTRITVPVI